LVEVEAQVAEVSEPPAPVKRKREAKLKKRSKGAKRSKRDGVAVGAPDSVQVARAEPLADARLAPVATKRSMEKLPAKPQARSAASKHRIQMARSYESAAAEPPTAAVAPPAPADESNEQRVAYGRTADRSQSKSGATPDVELRARGKRLVTEFDRHLKSGDSAKAASALEKLAKLPGFESAAKRKRNELRAWLKKHERNRSQKKSKSKSKSKSK